MNVVRSVSDLHFKVDIQKYMKKKSEDVQALGSFFNFLHLIPNSG